MSVIIPLSDEPTQQVTTTVGNQQVQLNIYMRDTALYCDVSVAHVTIVAGVVCNNLTKIVRDSYLGFTGELYFYDTQGLNDPTYPGIGSRYVLVYA
jgi:hypothetical protein